jgi:hypothetical protein
MNELTKKNEKYMTIKEVADIFNVSKDLIGKIVNELFPGKTKSRIKTLLNENEVTLISMRIKENRNLIKTADDRRQLSYSEKEKEIIILQGQFFQKEKEYLSTIKSLKSENETLELENKKLLLNYENAERKIMDIEDAVLQMGSRYKDVLYLREDILKNYELDKNSKIDLKDFWKELNRIGVYVGTFSSFKKLTRAIKIDGVIFREIYVYGLKRCS